MLKVGAKIDYWTIINIDPGGTRAVCMCECKTTRIISLKALAAGEAAPSCGCQGLTPAQRWELREAAAEKKRQQNMKDVWKPGK
jgi:hypothetical protein